MTGREMTLKEWVGSLPEGHLAQKQFKTLLEAAQFAEGSLSQVPDGVQVSPIVTMDCRDHLAKAIKEVNKEVK